RLKSAKFLAEYLVNNTCDRISVVVFQENDVEVIVPFTRNFNLVQRNLSKIDSKGLTPLALAIEKSLEYIESEKKKEILMMLITDGIPTVSNSSMDPVKDAINAARKIAEKNIYFSCIGLQPNKKHLEQIAKEGQGNLYIVDELRTDLLIHIANKEREAQ
ncbi:MAG TPA: VWA domain-containing protein, partial [Thermoanaerobacterales bacterium]|nr:VWA domain-containing protein [Thermoanaerobacterales bacterium]